MRRGYSSVTVLFCLLACYSSRAAVIDTFLAGPLNLIQLTGQPSTTLVQENLNPNQVIGGRRDVRLRAYGPPPNGAGGVQVIVDTSLGNFEYLADPGHTAVNFFIAYQGPTGDLQANLLSDGSNTLVLDFSFTNFELGRGYLDLTVDTTPGGRYLYVPIDNSATPFSVALPFKAFDTQFSAANFAHVVSINLGTGNGNLQGDFTLTGIRTAYFPDGDYNFDGIVDTADYQVWKSHYGQSGPYGYYPVDPADGNRNAKVDAADYTIWRNNLGAAAGRSAAIAEVPEPNLLMLAFGTSLSMIWFLQRHLQRN